MARVLPQLTLPHLQVAEALAALAPAAGTDLAELLGAVRGERHRGLEATLEFLADHALVWPSSQGLLHMVTPLRQVWDAPLGLDAPLAELLKGVPSDELRRMLVALGIKTGSTKQQRLATLMDHHSDRERVAALVARAPAAARNLLERRAAIPRERKEFGEFIMFGPPGVDSTPTASASQWALERGLLVQDRRLYGAAAMPAEVALALRRADWRAPFEPVPPAVRTVPVTVAEVEREATAAAMAFTAQAGSVLAACAASPLIRLKSGGVGARELSRTGKTAQCEDAVVRVVLETAYAAGLLARDGDKVAAAQAYDEWAEREPAERFTVLLHAWRALRLNPTRARDEDGKALPALAGAAPCDGCLQARDGLLSAATRLPAERGAQNPADLGSLVAWYRPLAHQLPQDNSPFATLVREAELLGVLARGALSPFGAALLDEGTETLATACQRLLPAAAGEAHFGADLTAVVAGTPTARLASLLDSVADREAGGTASVWRFGPGSVRRALDAGHTSESVEADLTAVAVECLPQSLSYLIHDVARGHGRIRVAPVACVIHGEEPALLAELAAHRKLTGLGLRQLAPTVLVSATPPDEALRAIRAAGYAPVGEAADGTVRIDKPARRRVAAPVPLPRRPGGTSYGQSTGARTAVTPATANLSALASRLRAAPSTLPEPDPRNGVPFDSDTEEIIAGNARQLSLTDVRQLAHAVNERQAVTIEYAAASGNRTVRTVSELELDAPYLYAWCHLRSDERMFTISRIQGVLPA